MSTNQTTQVFHASKHITPDSLWIFIVDNGFAYVGNMQIENDLVVITNGANIREAETSRGFGELAMDGPNTNTKLDPSPIILVPVNRMCHYMRCNSAKWDGKIPV